MRHALVGLLLTAATLLPAASNAAVNVSIGINVPVYPTFERIPNYPVYYAPGLRANYFFYDGLYWVFDDRTGAWYESSWYNGPWYLVDPLDVPDFLLRVPVRYYRVAPAFFHGWAYDAAPLWGTYWGSTWQTRRSGWDRWNRRSAPAPAPLPTYQRAYSGNRYPVNVSQQAAIQTRSYTYQPRESVSRQQWQERRSEARAAPAPAPQVQQRQAAAPAPQPQVQRQERAQQMQTQRQERAQQMQAQRQERTQQAQVQREQRIEAQQQRAERAQPQHENHGHENRGHENRGEDRGKGHDRD